MVAPALVLLVTFLIVPFVAAFVLSFTNQRLISPNPTKYVGAANYRQALTLRWVTADPLPERGPNGEHQYPTARTFTRNNPDHRSLAGLQEWRHFGWGNKRIYILAGDSLFIRALINTFFFALVIVPAQSGLGLVLALLVNAKSRFTNVFRTIYFLPVVTSMVVISILWSFLYNAQTGLINQVIDAVSFGLVKPINWLGNPRTALPAIMIMSIWQAVGFHMVIWLAGLQNIDGALYEAAAIDGASARDQFRFITWPGLRNTSVFILVTITIAALGLFTQVDVMTNAGPRDATRTVVYHAVNAGYGEQNIAYGSTIAVVFFVIVLFVAILQRYFTREAAQA